MFCVDLSWHAIIFKPKVWLLIKQVFFLLRLFTANVPKPCTGSTSPSPDLHATRAGSRAQNIRRSHDMASGLSSAHSDRLLAWSSIIDWCINGFNVIAKPLDFNALYFKLVMLLACNIHYTVYKQFFFFDRWGNHLIRLDLLYSSLVSMCRGQGQEKKHDSVTD